FAHLPELFGQRGEKLTLTVGEREIVAASPVSPDARWERVHTRSAIVPHRCPESVGVESERVELRLLARPRGDGRLAFVVHVEHEFRRTVVAVAEELLEDVRHV